MAIQLIDTLPVLPPRPRDAHKGDFGRVLVVAGSRGMSGAAVLCASACLRGGAGLVRLAVPLSALVPAAAGNPCYMTSPLPEDELGCFSVGGVPLLLELAREANVLVVGPGLGRAGAQARVVSALLDKAHQPMVLDADGLYALGKVTGKRLEGQAPLILTPHPGEFARVTGRDIPAVQADRQEVAVRFAADIGVILVLKGHNTIVTDGSRVYVNSTGNPGMATGGTGDVLAGLIGALVGQGLEAFAAAQLGVFLHGRAGDLAAADLGEVSLIASDLLDYLPGAFRTLPGERGA
jgi:ADP-dependent NAD(P)H-hydrate dehydratase